jgi:hypothetical protein
MIARLTLLCLALLAVSEADTLRFRDGSSVTGSFLGGSKDEIRFLLNNQVQAYPKADVVEVTFGEIGGAPAAAGPRKIVVEPDVLGVPFLQDPTEQLTPLERTTGVSIRQNTVYGPSTSIWRIAGARSPVRVREGKVVFVVRLAYGVDPRKFEIYALESKRDIRQTPPIRAGARPAALPVTIFKIGESSYGISPARFLGPGEYAVSPRDSNEAFCFGVDY